MSDQPSQQTAALPFRVEAGRMLFAGPIWDEWDLQFCIHGEKLRWTCDECNEAQKERDSTIDSVSSSDQDG